MTEGEGLPPTWSRVPCLITIPPVGCSSLLRQGPFPASLVTTTERNPRASVLVVQRGYFFRRLCRGGGKTRADHPSLCGPIHCSI